MISRHTEEKKLLTQMKDGSLQVARILMTSPKIFGFTTTGQLLNLVDANMAKPLSDLFGPSAGKVPGTYKRADFFAFSCNGGTIIATPEKGDKGTSWYYVPKDQEQISIREYLSLEHPSVIDILPAFFTELHEIFFKRDLDSGGFSPRANQKRQLWRVEPQRQELDQSTPFVKSTSPRRSL
jgi:hypothetical protein